MISIHSLRSDLADAIAVDLLETGSARIYGPPSTAVRVWNAIDRATRLIGGAHAQTARDGRGWLVVLVP